MSMEAVLQQQLSKPVDMTGNSEDLDLLMMDPFLDYINQILMEEGMDDATCLQQVYDVPYRAIFSGFNNILCEHSPPVDSTSYDEVVYPHQHICHYSENVPDEQHVKIVIPNNGFYSMGNEPKISLPATVHPHSSCQQERAEVGCKFKHHSGFQGHVMASHAPLKTTEIIGRHGMKNYMYNSGSCLNSNEATVSSPASYDTVVQNYHNAIKFNDGVLDMMVSCWGEDAVVEGLSGHGCMGGQEQGNSNFKLPTADEEFSSKLAEVDLSFEDLKLNDVYTDLYVGEPSSSTRAADSKLNRDKKKSLGSKNGKKRKSEVQVFVDVREVLVSCAQAVATGESRRTNEILQELRQVHGASANGTSVQRTAHFFSKALAMRMRGMGEHHFRAMSHNMPSALTVLNTSKFAFEVIPFLKVRHYFANQSILKAAEGASRLHIVDYGLMHGIQWPCLINALADRQGGPPLLVITGIEFLQPGVKPEKRLEESGRRLAAYARTYGVPFQYHAIVSNKLEDLDAASLNLHDGEVLVVNCFTCLCNLAEESVDLAAISPRQKLFTFMHSLNPHLLLTAVVNATYSSPFFVSRFREALYFFSNFFDMVDTLWGDTPQRVILERSLFYCNILNIVGCEGAERVHRPETYKQWHARLTKAGFEQLPVPPTILFRSSSHVKQHYHKDFFLIDDDVNGWMLMGWKGRTMLAISAWKPKLAV